MHVHAAVPGYMHAAAHALLVLLCTRVPVHYPAHAEFKLQAFAAVCKPKRPNGSGCKNLKLWFGANNGGYLVRPHLIFVLFSHVSCAFPRQIYPVCYFFSVCLCPVMSITETAERAQLSFQQLNFCALISLLLFLFFPFFHIHQFWFSIDGLVATYLK